MRKLAFLVLFVSNLNLFSQHRMFFDVDLGGAIPMHRDLKDVFGLGLILDAGFAFQVFDKNLYLKPSLGVKWYLKEIENVNSVKENVFTLKTGLEARYYCLKKMNYMIASFIRLDHNWVQNYYSESHYDPFKNQTNAAFSDNYIYGKGVSIAVGSIVHMNKVTVKINYEFFKPTLKVNPTILREAYQQGYIIEPTSTFNFNSLNVSVGYSLPLKK